MPHTAVSNIWTIYFQSEQIIFKPSDFPQEIFLTTLRLFLLKILHCLNTESLMMTAVTGTLGHPIAPCYVTIVFSPINN